MKFSFLVVALAFILVKCANSATASCNGECPKGYLSVCVERGSHCICRCAKDLDGGTRDLGDLLRDAGASREAIERAVREYRRRASGNAGDFSFSVEDNGIIYTVVASGALRGTSGVADS
jgi:hypothetical protein